MMATLFENIRKATTLLLAVFLWLHAFLFLNVQSALISKCTQLLRLTTSEVVLFGLLFIFSCLTASGFWKALLSVAYIYFFPFVLLAYAFYGCFLILRAINRWFKVQIGQSKPTMNALVVEQKTSTIAAALPATSGSLDVGPKNRIAEVLSFLLKPFRRFMLLWCILLIVATHTTIVWLCLILVLANLTRKMFFMLRVVLFSDPWLKKIEPALVTGLNTTIAALTAVTRETAPTPELKNLWSQVSGWKTILEFLKDSYLLSMWAWFLGVVFLISVYIYVAIYFSFAYYGIARVSGVAYSWPDAAVTSLFIPFFISELPKILAVRLLGGIHCALVVTLGVGTFVKFLRRKLEDIRSAAADLSDRFTDQAISEKYVILEAMFSGDMKK
jgi:hypothetical protein